MNSSRSAALVSALVLAVAAVAYFLTLTPTVPFWDSGEFIAVARILGVPHPPGTPFYVLLGRMATLVPWESVAQRVNALSALASALTVWLTYLCALRLVRLAQGADRKPWQEWVAIASAAVGALMLAFSDTFWDNSIEAEVYSLMSLAQVLVLWLGLRWWEAHDRKPSVAPLLVATYVMWLCVGLHLGVGIMGLPLIVLVLLVDRPLGILFAMPFLTLLRVPNGLEQMIGAAVLIANLTFLWLSSRGRMSNTLAIGALLASLPGLYFAFGDANFPAFFAVLTAAAVIVPMVLLARKSREGRILLLSLSLMVIGYSTHLYLPIRAAQHPAINEGAPATWEKMRDLLERKQYGEMRPFDSDGDGRFDRRGMTSLGEIASIQLGKEFWRYFERQWPVLPGESPFRAAIPILLGLAGGLWHFRRERKSFLYTFVFLGLSTAGMIVFLNFSSHEVRDRDYFFQSGFHAYTLWIALGVAWLVGWVRESFDAEPQRNALTVASLVLMLALPVMLARNLWHEHDRSGNYIAGDYARNMLVNLKPDAFLFTNGDNDTFPLWYLQEVEGFRKDVRIINLSLLNTDWYIRQLRDQEPRVPIALDDRTVDMLGGGAFQDADGRIVYTNEFMVQHILQQTRTETGWRKTPYFAVTVPQDFGYAAFFRQQGIVQEVMHDSTQAGFDEPATRRALYKDYRYRGLFLADGSFDPKVFKDDNARNLSRNYAYAHMQLAMHYRRQAQYDKAIAEMERVVRMFPDWVEIQVPLAGIYMAAGDTAKAWAFYDGLVVRAPRNPQAHYYRGVSFMYRGQPKKAAEHMATARALDPGFRDAYVDGFSILWDLREYDEAVKVLGQWVGTHPDDAEAARQLEAARAALGGGGTPLPTPPGMR